MTQTFSTVIALEGEKKAETDLLCKGDSIRGEVDLDPRALTADVEDVSLHDQLPRLDLLLPVVKQLLRVQLLSEGVAHFFQLLALHVVLPISPQHRLHPLEACLQLTINLGRGEKHSHKLQDRVGYTAVASESDKVRRLISCIQNLQCLPSTEKIMHTRANKKNTHESTERDDGTLDALVYTCLAHMIALETGG